MTEKETKKNREELKDHRIDEDELDKVSGGAEPLPNSKPYPGGLHKKKKK